ncbi:DUF599 domain-containing protein [Thalassotalea psychrophila]|uniref:DUF599 domain-containing protein n=1 Tax=Thalassotalea psychrophila TaxID=3065647 RepID=A0ABY9TZZ9_9GAMM|nr:DUF599 domain-containing protein [Colwelliaceae bacterium SQ149]
MSLTFVDFIALALFFICWIGYTQFARVKAKNTPCLSRVLHQHRILWMRQILDNDVRVSHAALLSNLDRHVAFFASTTLLILAGVLTLFTQVENVNEVLSSIPIATERNNVAIQVKLSLLGMIFVMAFFQFTWSMRQYGFLNILIGAAPVAEKTTNPALLDYAKQMGVVQDQAGHAYNYGLRSYYFSLAALSWFFHPLLFITSSLAVVYVLFYREFKSRALKAIKLAIQDLGSEDI